MKEQWYDMAQGDGKKLRSRIRMLRLNVKVFVVEFCSILFCIGRSRV